MNKCFIDGCNNRVEKLKRICKDCIKPTNTNTNTKGTMHNYLEDVVDSGQIIKTNNEFNIFQRELSKLWTKKHVFDSIHRDGELDLEQIDRIVESCEYLAIKIEANRPNGIR